MPTKTPSKPKKPTPAKPETPPEPPAQPQEPETAPTVQDPAAEPVPAIARHVMTSNMGLTIVGDPDFEVWGEIVATYSHVYDKSSWWVGDAIAYGEAKFGEKYAQAIKISGRKLGTLMNIVSVCQRVQISRRREKLSFKHHSLIAGLHYQTGDELLAQAEREGWNTDDMEKEVKRRKALAAGTAPEDAEPTRKPGSTAAKVAASGKPPQVPEGEKPLIWNGYPLRVVNANGYRQIYQGNESLPADEADKAAHHHGHAHGPALAAWLEENNFRKEETPCAPSDTQAAAPAPVAPTKNSSETGTETAPSTGASSGATLSDPAPAPIIPGEVVVIVDPTATKANQMERAKAAVAATCATTTLPTVESLTATAQSAEITPESFALMKAALDIELEAKAQLIAERDDARDQLKRYEAHTAAQTPIQRAETAILAFNAASAEVEWEKVGANKLLRSKWLERLLLIADSVIDRIQGQPINTRK